MNKFSFVFVALCLVCSCKRMDTGSDNADTRFEYENVVIFGVDGGGAFFNADSTPNCMKIFQNGAISHTTKTSYPSISAQCWGSMLHGVLPKFHGRTNDNTSKEKFDPESPYPSIFRILRAAKPDAELVSFCNWSNINYGIIEDNIGVEKVNQSPDEDLTNKALSYLSNHTPNLLFIAWDSVDAAGHSHGYGSEQHKLAMNNVDKMIYQLYSAMEKKGMLDNTLFILSADHGGTINGSHGGDSSQELNVFLGVKGKSVKSGSVITDVEVQDIPAIAAHALGLDIPDTWTGRVPSGVFPDVVAQERKNVEIPVSDIRKHETVPTPDINKIKTLLQDHKVLAYLPFDGNIYDAFGNTSTILNGKNYFFNAYFGKGVSLEDGYVTLNDVKFGTKSFSIALWLKTTAVNDDPSIISNKDWGSGMNNGFVLSLRTGDVKFNVGSRTVNKRMDVTATLPIDFDKGWMHLILVVDRDKNTVSLYYDFKLAVQDSIPEALRNITFDESDLNIGQDCTGKYPYNLPAQLDEMIITADVLTEKDIESLKQFYK